MWTTVRRSVINVAQTNGKRLFSNKQGFDSLVIGAYTETPQLTTQRVSSETRNLIQSQLALSNFKKAGDIRLFYKVGGVKQVAVVALGDKKKTQKHEEQESVRLAVKYISFTCKIVVFLLFFYNFIRLLLVFKLFNVKGLNTQVLMYLLMYKVPLKVLY